MSSNDENVHREAASQPLAQEVGRQPTASRSRANTHDGKSAPEVIISPHFKMIWLTITGLTVLLAFADILLSLLVKNPTASMQQAIAMCDNFAKVGFGAIFGMLGAKAL